MRLEEDAMQHVWKGFKPYRHIPMIIGGILIAVLLAFLLGLIVMLLWNWLMPEIFGLRTISYWQGWGLVLLAHILFKAGAHGHDDDHDHDDTVEWKSRFRDRIRRKFTAQGQEEADDTEPEEEEQNGKRES